MKFERVRFPREDYPKPDDPAAWDKFLRNLNALSDGVTKTLAGGLSLADNASFYAKEITFTATSGPIAASYYQSSSGSIPSTPVNFDTKVTDTHGAVTTGTGWKFTAPAAGIYRVDAAVGFTAAATGGYAFASLLKNGSEARRGRQDNTLAGSIDYTFTVNGQLSLSAGDTVGVGVSAQGWTTSATGAAITYVDISGPRWPVKGGEIRFKHSLSVPPRWVVVGDAQDVTTGVAAPVSLGNPAWATEKGDILINDISGVTAGRKYRVTLLVFGG